MTGPLRLDAGTSGVPALAFSVETTTGLYRAGTNDVRFAVATVDVQQWTAAGTAITGTATVTGTASATKLIPTGGTATGNGMYLPAANTLGFSTNGVLNMSLDGSGNLGIGTSSPGALLGVSGAGNIVRFGDGTNTFNIRFRGPNNWSQQLDTASDKFSIQRNSVDFFLVDSASNVGIGTASPGVRLDVSGADGVRARVVATSGGTSGMILSSAGNTAYTIKAGNADNSLRIDQDGTDRLTLGSGGNLGIGTTSPAVKLHVSSTSTEVIFQDSDTAKGSSLAALLSFHGSDGRAGYVGYPADSSLYINNQNNTPTLFFTNNVERMRLDASGNLGIGTASPTTKAEIYDASTGAILTFNSNTNNSARGLNWRNQGSANNFGSITADYTSGVFTYDAGLGVYAGQHVFRVGTNGERLRIDANGNIYGTAGTTSMTNGFIYVPAAAGVPTGAATAISGLAPIYIDTTNNRIYARVGGTWRYAALI
jgi:hypothetical protein